MPRSPSAANREQILRDLAERDPSAERVARWRELRAERGPFGGLGRTFSSIQRKMAIDFEASAQIGHRGDEGTAREGLLREFLMGPYLPPRFQVAQGSSHVVSSSGDKSLQMDVVIVDALNTPRLLDMGGIQHFPLESVYGSIQVKSNLDSARTVADALDNVASFKKLRTISDWGPGLSVGAGFGVLFAYTARLPYDQLVEAISLWQSEKDRWLWPNLVVVLDKGLILQTNRKKAVFRNTDVEEYTTTGPMFMPSADALLEFYLLLMDLLGTTNLPRLDIASYVDLPDHLEGHSVRFLDAVYAQPRTCTKHKRSYLRRVRPGAVLEVLTGSGEPIRASSTLEHFGRTAMEEGEEDRDVWVFNPEGLPLDQLLVGDRRYEVPGGEIATMRGPTIEELEIDGAEFWLPWFYVRKHGLIEACPKCRPPPLPALTMAEWRALFQAAIGQDPETFGATRTPVQPRAKAKRKAPPK